MSDANISTNYLSPLGYRFVFKRMPQMVYDLQTVLIPEIRLGDVEQPTPWASLPEGGDHIQYSYLPFNFMLDDNMRNYNEILSWMQGLAPPENFDEAKKINESNRQIEGKGRKSDGILIVFTAENLPNIYYYFRDLIPVGLGLSEPFSTIKTDVQYITGSAMFTYSFFKSVPNLSLLTS